MRLCLICWCSGIGKLSIRSRYQHLTWAYNPLCDPEVVNPTPNLLRYWQNIIRTLACTFTIFQQLEIEKSNLNKRLSWLQYKLETLFTKNNFYVMVKTRIWTLVGASELVHYAERLLCSSMGEH